MTDEPVFDLCTRRDYARGDLLLGKYRLLEKLAVGGMGEVWRAKNEVLQAEVAVKIMFELGRGSAKLALERAHTEARLAAQLHHPAVCSAVDFGVSDRGEPLVISELLLGSGLDELLLTDGPLSPTRAVQLMLPVIEGLGAAHDKGIVHRDVKPSNIFLARDEHGNIQPKLLDFGIARVLTEDHRITMAGVICGTPDYMSPEQARGSKDVDWRSDLWSVCATLYEMVSGRSPFYGENYNAVMFQVIHDPQRPLSCLREEDRELGVIIDRGLAKDREARFQSTRELAKSLSQFLVSRQVEVDVCGHSLRSRLISAAALEVSNAELELAERITQRASQVAVTLPPFAPRAPRRPTTRAEIRRGHRRWLVTALAAASLLGLAAWSSRPAAKSGAAQGAAASVDAAQLEASLAENDAPPRDPSPGAGTVTRTESVTTPETGATLPPAQSASPAPRRVPTAAAPPAVRRQATAEPPKKRAPQGKRNALGYDFGI